MLCGAICGVQLGLSRLRGSPESGGRKRERVGAKAENVENWALILSYF